MFVFVWMRIEARAPHFRKNVKVCLWSLIHYMCDTVYVFLSRCKNNVGLE